MKQAGASDLIRECLQYTPKCITKLSSAWSSYTKHLQMEESSATS